jgi:hypothetical protein
LTKACVIATPSSSKGWDFGDGLWPEPLSAHGSARAEWCKTAPGRVLVSDREADEPGPRYDMY